MKEDKEETLCDEVSLQDVSLLNGQIPHNRYRVSVIWHSAALGEGKD